MPNLIVNGDFERGLEMWNLYPEYMVEGFVEVVERTGSNPNIGRDKSLHLLYVRHFTIGQTLMNGSYCSPSSRRLHFSCGGFAVMFNVDVHYDDGRVRSTPFSGHWPEVWYDASVPLLRDRAIDRIVFSFEAAQDFFLDDVRLEGFVTGEPEPLMRRVPPEVSRDFLALAPEFEESMMVMEQELKRATALLSRQLHSEVFKGAQAEIAKRVPKAPPQKKR